MNFSLDDSQLALQYSVRRFCDGELLFNQRGEALSENFRNKLWGDLANLGVLGLPISEEYGGSGLGIIDAVLVVEELGRAMIAKDYIESILVCGRLVDRYGTPAQKESALTQLVSGNKKCSIALRESADEVDERNPLTAKRSANGWILSGKINYVNDPGPNGYLVVAANAIDDETYNGSVKLFLINADSVTRVAKTHITLDDTRCLDLEFDDLVVKQSEVLGSSIEEGTIANALQETLDYAQLALSASSFGALSVVFEKTLEYMKERRQFGKKIIEFQAVQHSLADFYIALEQLRSTIYLAAQSIGENDKSEVKRLIAAVHVLTVDITYRYSELAIQLHGAMGMTEECLVGRYSRSLVASAQRRTRVSQSLKEFGALSLTSAVGIRGGA